MFKGLFFFVRHGWRYDKRYILWRVLYQFVSALIPILATLMPKFIIDELLGPGRAQRLLLYVGILAGYTAVATALSAFFNMDGFTRRCQVDARFNADLHERLARSDYENLESPSFLDMQEKAKKFLYCDWHGFGYLLDSALNIVGQMFTLAGIAAIIATMNLWMVLLFALLAAAGTLAEGRAKKKATRLSLQVSADQRGWMYYAKLFDDFSYGKEIRLNAMGAWLSARERAYFTRTNENLKAQNDGFIRAGVWGAVFGCVSQCAAYAYMIGRVAAGALSIGAFTMQIAAVTAFSASLRSVMNSLIDIRAYDAYYEHLDEYLSMPMTLREGPGREVPQGDHRIEFRDVGFRYQGAGTWALRHVSITLSPGEKLSVVGENGAGKTTFIKLLTRLYDPTEGEILLDGVNIREIAYERYLELFAAVFQDYKLFSFSLRENVCLARPADDGKIERALRRVGLGDKLDALPKGIDTAVYKHFDETGFEPSGGEGQKIALARALYKDAPIVVLDEPTAALDPRAEFELYRHFDEWTRGKTAIYISHRLSSARFCDQIAVFEGGRIVEYGTHAQLTARRGRYAELYAMQAGLYGIGKE